MADDKAHPNPIDPRTGRPARVPVQRTARRAAYDPVHSTPMSSALPRTGRPDRSRHSPSNSGGTDEEGNSRTSPTEALGRPRSASRDRREKTEQEKLRFQREIEQRQRTTDAERSERAVYSREPMPGVRGVLEKGDARQVAGLTAKTAALRIQMINDEDLLTRPAKYLNRDKTGKAGRTVQVTSNYVEIRSPWNSFVVLYDVQFTPDEPYRKRRIEFVEKLMGGHGIVAPEYIYNGRNLVYLRGVAATNFGKMSQHKTFAREGEAGGVRCTVTFARTVQKDDREINQFLNNMKNYWIQDILKMAMLGRAHYDPTAVIKVAEGNVRVHLWPGFETSIADYDGGKLFNIDNRFKVIRDTTMLVIINDAFTQGQRQRMPVDECRYAAAEAVVGSIVITQYSDKPRTYRVTGVEWDKSIEYMFEKDKKKISLKDYYKQKYGIVCKDNRQPLLVAEETGQARFKVPDMERKTYLIPELCNPTGLTDEMRANFRLMKTMADHTLQQPELRTQKIYDFMGRFLGNEGIKTFTKSWMMDFAQDLVTVQSRVLNTAGLQQGTKKFSYQLPRADWGMDLRSGRFHLPFANAKGILFAYPTGVGRLANDFLQELKFVGGPMGWNPPEPDRYEYDNDRNIVNELRRRCKGAYNLVIVMLQMKTKGRYDEIKLLLNRELPVISQCVVRKTLENQKNLRTVATKIAMQMGCKLGGAPWALDVSRFVQRGNIMFIGVDTFHDSGHKGGSRAAVAVVGTLDAAGTEYCSKVFFQSARQEIGEQLRNAVVELLEHYKTAPKNNKRYPDMVVFYRDGVGSGQLNTVMENEVKAIRDAIDTKKADTKMAFIVVTKRHSTRFMVDNGKSMDNPMPGTVVDTGVCKPNRMDFYIVAQSVRQGTVSPTYYNVLYDDTALNVDEIQQLTYAQCCMYFNWTGPVKVPAPCQYAHKLAFLIGQSIHDVPAEELNHFLYFL